MILRSMRPLVYGSIRHCGKSPMKICPTIPQPGATGTPAKAGKGQENSSKQTPGQCWGTTDLRSWANVLLHYPACQGLLVDDFSHSAPQPPASCSALARRLYS